MMHEVPLLNHPPLQRVMLKGANAFFMVLVCGHECMNSPQCEVAYISHFSFLVCYFWVTNVDELSLVTH